MSFISIFEMWRIGVLVLATLLLELTSADVKSEYFHQSITTAGGWLDRRLLKYLYGDFLLDLLNCIPIPCRFIINK